ncbi:MAG: hypothetical protein ABWY18_01260 [Tardiphaga sp.]
MRPMQRLVSAAVLIALSSALTGCGSMSGWDPADLLDFLDTKKKLPGDRKPVFPEGVPGLQQGVPKELYRENVEREQAQQAGQATAVAPAAPAEAPKAKSRSKGRVNVGTVRSGSAPASSEAAPAEDGDTAAAPPPPKGRKIVRRRTTTPEDPSTTAPSATPPSTATPSAPVQQGQGQSAFPAPVPSGSFSR